jgi:hypothetical protein
VRRIAEGGSTSHTAKTPPQTADRRPPVYRGGAAPTGKVSLGVATARTIGTKSVPSAEAKLQFTISTCMIPQTSSIALANQFIKAIHIAESVSIA